MTRFSTGGDKERDLKSPYGNTDRGTLQAIGLAVVNYSHVEEALVLGVDFLIIGTLPDDVADLIARKLPFRRLLETFAGLYHHRFPKDNIVDLQKLCRDLEKLTDERNQLIHSFWTPGTAADQLRRFSKAVGKRGAKTWDANVSEADVLRFAESAEETFERLVNFIAERILQRIDGMIPRRS